ncbi:MAG: ABC transporter permease [Flavobacteriales bacterium]
MRQIAINEIKMFFRDKRAVMLTFLMPMALIFLFALIFGGAGTKSDMGSIEIGICDLDSSKKSKEFVHRLDTSSTFELVVFNDSLSMKDQVFKGKIATGLIILPHHEKLMADGAPAYVLYIDKTRKTEAAIVQPLLTGMLMETAGDNLFKPIILEKIKESWPDMDSSTLTDVQSKMGDFGAGDFFGGEAQPDFYTVRAFVPVSGTNPGLVQAFAGTAVMTLLFAVAGMGTAIIEEKERGTLRKILTSPVTPMQFLGGKMLSTVIISTTQLTVLALFTWLAFGLPVLNYPVQIILMIFFTALACSSFGIFLATITSSRKQIESLSTLVVLLMSMLGGSMVPSFFMPALMQKFSAVTINYWSTQGFFDIFLREAGVIEILYRCAILTLFFAVLMTLSVYFSRKKLFRV